MRKYIILVLIVLCGSFLLNSANVSSQPYGINVHVPDNAVLAKIVNSGIKWIRVSVDWFAVEPSRGTFDWSQHDRVAEYADSHGLSILFTLSYTPSWANNGNGTNAPADNPADWENFVRTTVNRYKSKVKYWAIWNEPNTVDFFSAGKEEFLASVFLPAARAVRTADPSAFIVGPELSHLTSAGHEWYFWMKYILVNGGNYIDIVSHHIYKEEGVSHIYDLLEQGEHLIPSVKSIVEDSGQGNKPFWITETGWNTSEFSEAGQADKYVLMLNKREDKNYPQKIFFYEIKDDLTPGISPWGILRNDLTEKPAYEKYKGFIAGDYRDNGTNNDDDDDKKCFVKKSAADSNAVQAPMILSGLRALRDEMEAVSPAGRRLSELYYHMSLEFLEFYMRDSRVRKLGADIFLSAGQIVSRSRGSYVDQGLGTDMVSKIRSMLVLLKQKDTTPFFRRFVRWGEKQADILERTTLKDYLKNHAPAQLDRLYKVRPPKNNGNADSRSPKGN
ncbi:MAG: endo-1,4-beta-xylanase [bacterium]|nr:endo-1,4-beta-xylanase [bacterium]